jgi:signal transduction histidine kinase
VGGDALSDTAWPEALPYGGPAQAGVPGRDQLAESVYKFKEGLLKATENAEAAYRVGDELLTREIRTSLQSIVLAIDLLLRTSLTAEQAEYVEIVRLEATNLERLLDEVSPS